MIQDINKFSARQVNKEHILTSPTNENEAQNKEVMLAFSKIQLGDVLSGKVILENDQTMLKLANGLKLLAQLPNHIMSDQLLDFLVVGKSRQHLELECLQKNYGQSQNHGMEDEVIQEMQLPRSQEMKQIVEQWMDGQLPLVKHQLLQVHHFVKNYDLPPELLVNLRGNQSALSEQDIQLVSKFKEQGIHVIDDMLDQAFLHLDHNNAVELSIGLSQHSAEVDLKQVLIKGLEKHINQFEMSTNDIKHHTSQEALLEARGLAEKLIKQVNELDFTNSQGLNDKENLLKEILKLFSNNELNDLTKELGYKRLSIQQKKLPEQSDEVRKLEEGIQRLKEVIEQTQKYVKHEAMSQSVKSLEQMTEALDKYQAQGQYYCFPLNINEQQTTGELYYFKPKKNKNGAKQSQGMHIVLALDMPSLKHIEIHLVEQKDALSLKIKVANEEILEQMKAYEEKLRTLMSDTIVPIGDISVECLQLGIKEKIAEKRDMLSRLDFRI